jgi:MFS transporter, AAHS family, 4-hydroxybenzoate transporter
MTNSVEMLNQTRLTTLQISTIFICFLMNMLDGMDVTVISYTAPSIAKAWGITPQVLGAVFSAGLVGMGIGGVFLAPFADRIGRRWMIIICAIIMGITIFATAYSQSVAHLILFRLISGIGIGAMLASVATLTAEYAPKNTKDFWVSIVFAGYPTGAVIMGLSSAQLIPMFGWQSVFQFAGILTAVAVPFLLFLLPESLDFLIKIQPNNALNRANTLLKKMNEPLLTQLSDFPKEEKVKTSIVAVLASDLKIPTILLASAIFMAFATLYFLTNWIPKLASSAGLSLSLAIYAGTVFNLGSIAGIVTQGYLSSKFGLQRTICAFLVAAAALMMIFGWFTGSDFLLILFGLIGFTMQGGFVGLYGLAARLYPTAVRATGVGLALGLGRAGAILGPIVGGLLIGAGFSMAANFMIFAIPLVISGVTTLWIVLTDR